MKKRNWRLFPPDHPSTKDWLIEKRRIDPVTGCWIWTGLTTPSGYGRVTPLSRWVYVHRLAFSLWHYPISDKLNVCHKCDNPPCFNPDHLFAGTVKDNSMDCVKKGRNPKTMKLDERKVRMIRNSEWSNGDLAKQFGVCVSTIKWVRYGVTWAWVK